MLVVFPEGVVIQAVLLKGHLCNSTVIQPVINSVLTYIQTVTAEKLPSNLIQAQRDYFGAHTYKRIDKEGDFTGGWVTD